MIRLTASLQLLLLLLTGRATAVTVEQSVKVNKVPGEDYLTAPDSFPDGSFAFANIKKLGNRHKEIHGNLSIVGRDLSNNTHCSFTVGVSTNTVSIGLNSLRRYSKTKLLLSGYEETLGGARHGMMISFDLQNCKITHLFSGYYLSLARKIATAASIDELYVFMPDGKARSCWNNRNGAVFDERYSEFSCFKVDLAWPGLRVGSRFIGRQITRFIVRGFDTNGTYKVFDYDTKNYHEPTEELLSLPDATNKTKFASFNNALCYIINPGVDTTVHCSAFFDKDDKRNYSKIITFDVPVNLLAISYVNYPEEMIVVTANIQCEGVDCNYVTISSISSKLHLVNQYTINLKCTDRKERSVIGVQRKISQGAIVVQYVCDNDNELTFNMITVSTD